jgi:N-methylhydantoinase A
MIIIGVDTGGTFTDFIYKRGGEWGVHKRLSTPGNPSDAVIEGLRHIVADEPMQVVHGSTVATNAILERKGVTTAIVTNKGFEDLIQIGRQNRERLYDLFYSKASVIVPPGLRFGVGGRFSSEGEEIEPFDEGEASEVARRIKQSGAESVAVCFLFSYLDPGHEQRMARLLRELGVHMSLSHEILAEFREFERISTTVVNAYVSPKMSRYLENLNAFVGDNPLRVMQSNGGSISVDTAMEESVRTILSGPAGGVVGAMEIGRNAGFEKIISFDMGGTSTDVCLMDGHLPLSLEANISGYPLKVPMIDIHTVGAGGGSIARLDAGGSLKVGPESAGADPGPICYGKGEEITVTDANLSLGRLIPDRFLGGNMRLSTERMRQAFLEMSRKTGLSPTELGEGIVDVANTNMERAIRVISVERGFDPREFTLLSFGGAGGMHCAYLARLLSIPRVLVPKNPGILSAVGMVMADVIKDYSQTVMLPESEAGTGRLESLFAPLEQQGRTEMLGEGFDEGTIHLERYLDMRYRGQSFEIIVPFEQDYTEAFAQLHEQKYGYRNPDKPVEVVNLRLRSRGTPQKPKFKPAGELVRTIPPEARVGRQEVVFDGKTREADVLDREQLLPGNSLHGPAVIVEYTSTIVVPPFATGEVDGYGNIVMTISG